MKVVIMAGGKGTRIANLNQYIPKSMFLIDNKPVLEYQIDALKSQGYKDILITVGHLKDVIIDYFGDGSKISPSTKEPFGVSIEYYVEKEPLGNAGALIKMRDKFTEDFLLLNGDLMFDINFTKYICWHKSSNALVSIVTHPNNHPYDSGLIISSLNDNLVEKWLTKEDVRPQYYRNRVNAGIHIINPRVLMDGNFKTKVDLDRDILRPLAGTGNISFYDTPEYIKDMGTPERYNLVKKDIISGKVKSRNLINKQKAIFLDRDGIINKHVGFLHEINKFELIEGVSEVIKCINNTEYLCIVITNQPVIARGQLTFEELGNIHNKMETILGLDGAYLDDIFYCPHHPDKGYVGEIEDLKIKCLCRKPSPGMLLEAAQKYNIDLNISYMVGDSECDIKAGLAAGCNTVLLGDDNFGQKHTIKKLSDLLNILEIGNEK